MLARRLVPMVLLLPSLLVAAGAATASTAPSTGPVVLVVQDGNLVRGDADLTSTQLEERLTTVAGSGEAGLRPSADGSRVVYVLQQPPHGSTPLSTRVVVRDAGGRLVRYLDGQYDPDARGAYLAEPALTPDGNQAVWTIRTPHGISLRAGLIATPGLGVRPIPNTLGLSSAVPLSNQLTMLALSDFTVVSVTHLGTRRVVTGLPAHGVNAFSVSPDGTRIAYSHFDSGFHQLSVAPLVPGSSYPSYSVGPSTLVVAHFTGDSAHFSQDGNRLYWGQDYDIWSVPTAGGGPTKLTNTPDVHEFAATGALLDDGTPPGPVTSPSVTLGERPVVRWTLPTDTDLSGVSLVRTAEGQPTKVRFVPAPLTSFTEEYPLLDTGTTYTYTLTAVDRSGHPAATKASISMQPRFADVVTSYPTSRDSSVPPFRVVMPVGTYNLSVRTNGTGDFVRIATGGSGNFVFGQDYGTTSRAGDSYRFRVQVFDQFGNATLPTVQPPAVVPYDDAALTYTGPTALLTASKAFLGSEHVLHDGATAGFTAIGNKITVVGASCRTCGSLYLYVDGRLLGVAHTLFPYGPASYHHDRESLVSVAGPFVGNRAHTIRIVAHGGDVVVDGVAFRR